MNLLKDLGKEDGDVETFMVDNVFAINLIKNSTAHGRSKHIEMSFHYVRKFVSERRLRFGYCRSEYQVANLLTKGVTIEVFKRLEKNMSMKDLKHMN